MSWWLFKPQSYAIRHSKVDKCFGRVRVAYWSTFAQERCTIVECCLVAALVELRSGGVLPEHTEKKGWTSTQQIECHLYHHYAISTGASSRILRMEMFPGVFNTNLSCAVNKIETVRLFPRVILVMFEKTSVSSGHRWDWGTESKPLPQFGVRCVESVTRWIRLFGEISNSHASLKWRTFIIDA